MTERLTLLRRISIGLAVVGIFVAGYLTWSHYTHSSVQCIGGSNECDIVQGSVYSSIAGFPVALLGLLAYIAILGLLVIEEKGARLAENAPLVLFGMTLIGFAYSVYLTYLELAVIHAICQYCVTSAVLMTILFGIAIYRVLSPTEG